MTIYICNICKKKFNRKCNFIYHIKEKKRPCSSNFNDDSLLFTSESNGLADLEPKLADLEPKLADLEPKLADQNDIKNIKDNTNLNINLKNNPEMHKKFIKKMHKKCIKNNENNEKDISNENINPEMHKKCIKNA